MSSLATMLRILTCVLTVLFGAWGCVSDGSQIPAKGPAGARGGKPVYKAAVVTQIDQTSQKALRSVEVTKPEDVAVLVAFLPGVGEGKQSDMGWGYRPTYKIRLTRQDGGNTDIIASDEVWSEHGDWLMDPKFRDFVAKLFSRQAH